MPEPTPWAAWLRAAQSLGLSPHRFWRLAFREWRALTAPPSAETLTRAAFDALQQRFPDHLHDR